MRNTGLWLIIISLFGCDTAAKKKVLAELQHLPALQVLMMDSTTVLKTQNLQLPGSLVMVYFSITCPSCKKETEGIIENMAHWGNTQFLFISPAPPSALRDFAKKFKLDQYNNIKVTSDFERGFREKFKPSSIPYTVIYGRDKKLVKIYSVAPPIENMQKLIVEQQGQPLTQN